MVANIIKGNKVNKINIYNYISRYKNFRKEIKNNYIIFLEAMVIGIFLSLVVEKFLWWKGTGVVHSVFGLICVVFNMSLFFIVWNKYKDSPTSSKLIAFGFLATTIFDVIHIYFFGPLGFAIGDYSDLERRFWILGRLTEIIMIFVASLDFSTKRIKINKTMGLIISIFLPVTISYVSIRYTNVFPSMYDNNGLTKYKLVFETIIVSLAIISLLRHKKRIQERGYISYRYLALALYVMIPTEICFMVYKTNVSVIVVYGHMFRIIYCYFLHKSIFQSSIEYTYDELEQSRRRFKDILDSIPIGIGTYDNNLTLDFANKEVERLLGCKREEIIGLTNKEIYNMFKSDDSKPSLVEQTRNENIEIRNVITTLRRKNGEKMKLYMDSKNIEDGILLVLKDAGREQEIDSLHIQTYTILNSMQSPAFICDNKYNMISVNKSFEELIGLHYKELMEMNLEELLQLINCYSKESKIIENAGSGAEVQFDISFINLKGIQKEIILNMSSILNLYGDCIGKISVITDVTDLKQQQEKTLHTEKLALLGQMGATIVHETRNFLTTIKGCSQLIEVMSKHDKVIEYAKKININTDEVNAIISDFLSLSKPKQAITEEIAVCDLLESIKSTIETSSLIKGVEMEFIYNIDDRYVLCDEMHMTQVVLNMCKNAVDAMDEVPKPKLIIEAGIIEDKNNIYIKISDNGKGMNKETLSKIGTAFFTTKQSGTGLGISVCYDIIKQHGGWIEVASEEGVGTTFTINLPGLEDSELEEVI